MLGVIPVPLGSAVGPGRCTPVLARAPTVVLHTYSGTPEPPEGKGSRNLTQCPVSFQRDRADRSARVALPEAGVQGRAKAPVREVREGRNMSASDPGHSSSQLRLTQGHGWGAVPCVRLSLEFQKASMRHDFEWKSFIWESAPGRHGRAMEGRQDKREPIHWSSTSRPFLRVSTVLQGRVTFGLDQSRRKLGLLCNNGGRHGFKTAGGQGSVYSTKRKPLGRSGKTELLGLEVALWEMSSVLHSDPLPRWLHPPAVGGGGN